MTPDGQPENSDCPAYVLAGGQSRRHGGDKSLVEIEGQPQLSRLIEMLADQGHSTHIVADSEDRYRSLGFSCLVDEWADSGPLAGLARATSHRLASEGEGWLLVLGCDQVLWRPEWFILMRQAIRPASAAVVFEQSGRRQPIPALVHTRMIPPLLTALRSRQLSLQTLLSQVSVETITTTSNPRDWSFNTPAELQRILTRFPTE